MAEPRAVGTGPVSSAGFAQATDAFIWHLALQTATNHLEAAGVVVVVVT